MSSTSAPYEAVPFPTDRPAGFEPLGDEPAFDPERHLDLSEPESVTTLRDLGYSADEVVGTASDVAISSPIRILSEEGAAVMLETARRLRPYGRAAGDRIERSVRAGVYRSSWLRDLCLSPDVAEHMSAIYGTDVAPHPMGVHLGHLNYEPSVVDAAVDKWHHDTLPLDYVMTVTDPTRTPGGRFEYFLGTKAEAAAFKADGQKPPPDRVVAPGLPGPGWAVAMHGNMVVHRGGPLTAKAERITMVNGYVALDASRHHQSRTVDLLGVDDPEVLFTEWTRFAAWRTTARLQALIDEIEFGTSPGDAAAALTTAVQEALVAADEMQRREHRTEHYE